MLTRGGLTHGDWRLEMMPELGGAISRLTWRDRNVLQPAPSGARNPLQMSTFPLAPYCNRIMRGQFVYDGEKVRLRPNKEDEIHPLHGQAWKNPWQVVSTTDKAVTLRVDYKADDWPWAYTTEQTITLGDRSVRMDVSVRNLSTRAMPVGLGFHPAFPAPAGTRLLADVDGVWLTDDEILPTQHLPMPGLTDWRENPLLSDAHGMDHCHTGWRQPAVLSYPTGLRLTITANEASRWLHLYVPSDRGYICLEPVTHMPDAFRQPELESTGMQRLEPGQSTAAWMVIDVGGVP